MHACIHTDRQTYIHTYTYIHIYRHTYIHAHTHTHTYTVKARRKGEQGKCAKQPGDGGTKAETLTVGQRRATDTDLKSIGITVILD